MAASANDAHPYPIYNARYRVVFPILDADGDLVTGAASLDSEASQDTGTFADCTNEATEIATSSGMYFLDLISTELDTKSTAVIVKTATAGAKTTALVLYPTRLPVIRTGTAQAGAASTVTLDSGASATDDFYNGCFVNITNNSPANALGQARRIIDYVGSTKVATVEGTWGTNPSSASTFEILLSPEANSSVALAGTPHVDPATVGRFNVNATHVAGTVQTAGDIIGDTNDIQARLPAALVSGRMDSSVGAMAANTLTATAIAADAITDAKVSSDVTIASVTGSVGSVTGNVGGNVVGSVASVTAGVTLAASAVQAIWDALTSALTTVGSIGKLLVDNVNATIGSRLATAGYTAPPSTVSIADAVWDEEITVGHTVADSAGAKLNAAGGAADPWATALPGAYGAGTAGKIVGDNVNATISSRATQTSVDAIDDFVDTEVAAIKAKTDNLPAAPAAVGDIPTTSSITTAVLTTAMTESYAADGVAPTLAQSLFMLLGKNYEFAIAGDTLTVKKLDGSTSAMTFTLAPAGGPYTSITRAS